MATRLPRERTSAGTARTDPGETDQATVKSQIGLIGRRLRQYRETERLSLRDAASRSGLSASFIGTLERGESEIAVTRLMRLADVYGVTVSDLLTDLGDEQVGLHVEVDMMRRVTSDDGKIEMLYVPGPPDAMQPFRLILHPGARQHGFEHGTVEFHQCIEGRPRFFIDDNPIQLKPGETVFIPAGRRHGWENPGKRRSVMVGAVARPETPFGLG